MKTNTAQTQPTEEQFALADEPTAYIISVHIRNMMATYGEETVKSLIKELFLTTAQNETEEQSGTNIH